MKKFLYIILPVAILSFLFTGCDQQNEQHLQGTWELISKPNENYEYKWVFVNTKVHLLATDVDDPLDGGFDTCTVGHFVLKNGVLTIAAEDVWCSYMTYVGDWDIEKLDANFMTLRRESSQGSIWFEFQKAE